MTEKLIIIRNQEDKRHTIIVTDRTRVAEKETIRLRKTDKTRRDKCFEHYKATDEDCKSAFMRHIIHLGLDEYEKKFMKN